MRTIIIINFIISIMFLSDVFSLEKVKTGDIFIVVQGLKNDSGQVIISIHSPFKGNFPNDKAIIKSEKAYIKNGTAIIEFKGIEYKTYAFAVHHDENSNGKMDTNLIGIPKEGWGFSNNAKGLIGPPSFDKAEFELKTEKLKLSIKINY